jgi:hypothetical protein
VVSWQSLCAMRVGLGMLGFFPTFLVRNETVRRR